MIVTGQTWQLEIPHEPGEKMTFRKLSFRELEMAADIRKKAIFADLRDMGFDMLSELQKMQQPTTLNVDQDVYDRVTVLQKGIVAWTYPQDVIAENINALDKETADWAVNEILKAHHPRTEKEKKADSGTSMRH